MVAEILKFPVRMNGKRQKETEGRGKKEREDGRKGRGTKEGEKGKGIEWGGVLGKAVKLCKKNGRCLACYHEEKHLFEL